MNKLIVLTLIGAIFAGCVDIPQNDSLPKASNVTCVVIGMEKSQRFGACPGCKRDSDRMAELLRKEYGYPVQLFQSQDATRLDIVNAIKAGIDKTPEDGLFILYYSGHGGQELLSNWSTSEPEGADKEDEFLCLYDDYLLDDEIWELIRCCKGRVFLGFDACHSKTMYRSVQPEYLQRRGLGIPLKATPNVSTSGKFRLKPKAIPLDAKAPFRMLCWSGCQEKEYSFGSSFGGVMTNAILGNWSKDKTYQELWIDVQYEVLEEQPTQHPESTQYGTGFDKVFR